MTSTITPMPFEQLEKAYEGLAEAIDRAGAGNEALFLAKLALLQARHHGDLPLFERCVSAALQDLPAVARDR